MFAYGWPRALVTGAQPPDDSDVVYCSAAGDALIVVVCTATVQVWAGGQHRLKLGELARSAESLAEEGHNARAHWCPARRVLAVATGGGALHLYGLHAAAPGGGDALARAPGGAEARRVAPYLQNSVAVGELGAGAAEGARVADLAGDARSLLVALSDGTLAALSWAGRLRGAANPFAAAAAAPDGGGAPRARRLSRLAPPEAGGAPSPFAAAPAPGADVELAALHYAAEARLMVAVLGDGAAALLAAAPSGIDPVGAARWVRWLYRPARPGTAAVAAAVAPGSQWLALGLANGRVALHATRALLAGGGGGALPQPVRTLSLSGWGYSSAVVGAAHVLAWAPDGGALAVGYLGRGVAVWTPSGCRVMCSLRQAAPGVGAPAPAAPPAAGRGDGGVRRLSSDGQPFSPTSALNPQHLPLPEPGILEGPIAALAWAAHGYSLVAAEAGAAVVLYELSFARAVRGDHRAAEPAAGVGGAAGVQVLQAADRLLLVCEAPPAAGDAALAGLGAAGGGAPAAGRAGGRDDDGGGGAAAAGGAVAPRPDLSLQHVRAPQQYLDAAFPLLHAALSADRADVAVAGARGLALYSRRSRRWRLFGDARQERALRVHALAWLPGGVVAACASEGGAAGGGGAEAAEGAAALLLYPKAHLDAASLLGRLPLPAVPLAVDAAGPHVVLAFEPLLVQLLRVDADGGGAPGSARFVPLRELSIMGAGPRLLEMGLVAAPIGAAPGDAPAAAEPAAAAAGGDLPRRPPPIKVGRPAADGPAHCVLLRAGGGMSVLSLDEGVELPLADGVERFWLPAPSAEGAAEPTAAASAPGGRAGRAASAMTASSERVNELAHGEADDAAPPGAAAVAATPPGVELPWWTYGAAGMQLWFPSALRGALASPLGALGSPQRAAAGSPRAGRAGAEVEPELEFDAEVYPVGVSMAEVSIIGATQRAVRSPAFPPDAPQSLALHPLPESQPVLPCLLRRLLAARRFDDALELARWRSRGPHFARSLEWLLFTALEMGGGDARDGGGHLLRAAARLVQRFPAHAEIAVSVARKTDASLWPALFAAVGPPSALCRGLTAAGALQAAACCLLLVQRQEGAPAARALALRLLRAALAGAAYPLAADLLRFLAEAAADGGAGAGGVLARLWSFLVGDDVAPPAPGTPLGGTPRAGGDALDAAPPAAADAAANPGDESLPADAQAWGLVGRRGWALLEQGSLRELGAAAAALERVRGGLAAALAATAPAFPAAAAAARRAAAPDAAAALLAAGAQFAALERGDAAAGAAAAALLAACRAAALPNHAVALALLLGDGAAAAEYAAAHPAEWAALAVLVANDAHLCNWAAAVAPARELMRVEA